MGDSCRMGKQSKRAKGADRGAASTASGVPERAKTMSPPLQMTLLVLAGAGILLTVYLTYGAWFDEHPAFCGEGSGCDVVQTSRWSTFLGVPMAFWGLLTYAGIAALAWRSRRKPSSATALLVVAVAGFAISAYLTVISVVEIRATCPYCLASFAIMTATMAVTLLHPIPNRRTTVIESGVIALVLVGVLHLHYSGIFSAAAGPEDPRLRALAVHLSDTGATFYGASWCHRCKEQKELFGPSAQRLPYVECSPGGPNGPQSALCMSKNITSYPTWIVRDRRYTGLQTPRELADAANFAWGK